MPRDLPVLEPAPLATAPGTLAPTPLDLSTSPAAVYLAQLAPSGRRTMAQALDAMAQALGYPDALSCPWHRLRYQHTTALRQALQQQLAPATVNKYLAALRRVLEEAWRLDLMPIEAYKRAADLKGIKAEREPSGRALTLDELQALIGACAADPTPAGLRDAALIAVLAAAGLRRSEAAALPLSAYEPAPDGDGGRLRIVGKGNKERIVYLAGGAATALADWLTLRGDAPGAMFTATTRHDLEPMTDQAILVILRKRAEEAGVKRFSPHDLRRTFITRQLEAGTDVFVVQSLAGHADPATTKRYDRRGEAAKRQAASAVVVPVVPNVARRTLPLQE